jgi:hypothetical protein
MPHDLVNRDYSLEKEFVEASKRSSMERPHLFMLYQVWLDMRSLDLSLARNKRFRTLKASLYFAEVAFEGEPEEDRRFYEYMKWFLFNRLINTGSGGHAICELSPIFVRPKQRHKPNTQEEDDNER